MSENRRARTRSLYLHIPFFAEGCVSAVDFSRAIEREIDIVCRDGHAGNARVAAWGVGKGASAIDPHLLNQVLKRAEESFRFLDGAERSVELSWRSAVGKRLAVLRAHRFSRVCLTSWNRTLPTSGEMQRAVRHVRESGVGHVAVDISLGGGGERKRVLPTLDEVLSLEPDHIHINDTDHSHATEEEWVEAYEGAVRLLEEREYERYEIAHFARSGHRSMQTMILYRCGDVLGLGPGAVTTIGSLRRRNRSDPAEYIADLRSDRLPVEESEKLDRGARLWERILLGIRLSRGIDIRSLGHRFAFDLEKSLEAPLGELIGLGLVSREGSRIFLTAGGVLVADRVVEKMILDGVPGFLDKPLARY